MAFVPYRGALRLVSVCTHGAAGLLVFTMHSEAYLSFVNGTGPVDHAAIPGRLIIRAGFQLGFV